MTKNRTMLTIIVGSIATLLVVAFLAISISAHTEASAKGLSSQAQTAISIVETVHGANYTPSQVTTGKAAGQSTLTVTNSTTVSQTVTYNGKVKVAIPAGKSRTLTIGEGTFVFSLLSNPQAKLTVVGV